MNGTLHFTSISSTSPKLLTVLYNRPALESSISHYGAQDKLISIIKMLYTDLNARVIWGTNLTDEFKVKTGVKQECLLFPLLFTFCIDWIMKETIKSKRIEIS